VNTWPHNFAGPDFTAYAPFGGAGGAYRAGICLGGGLAMGLILEFPDDIQPADREAEKHMQGTDECLCPLCIDFWLNVMEGR
jgi:hypothetical protein